MLTIRDEQRETLETQQRSDFNRGLAETFRQAWPLRVRQLGPGRYDAFIGAAIERAHSLGIDADQDVARFVNLTLLWGFGFEASAKYGWARPILDDPDAPPGLKVQNLVDESLRLLEAMQEHE